MVQYHFMFYYIVLEKTVLTFLVFSMVGGPVVWAA